MYEVQGFYKESFAISFIREKNGLVSKWNRICMHHSQIEFECRGGEEMKASIALQILPLSTDKGRLAVIEDVIEYLQKQPVRQLVTPLKQF